MLTARQPKPKPQTYTAAAKLPSKAPALCPPDDWHSVNGFIGSRQAMETFFYDHAGGLSSMHVAGVKA